MPLIKNILGFNSSAKRKQNPSSTKQNAGDWAEDEALQFLLRQSMQLRDRNYRCRQGEIDLIMSDKNQVVVFVEVRYRKQASHGSPFETVDQRKQAKLIATAQHYLQKQGLSDKVACRFDVVSIQGEPLLVGKNPPKPGEEDHISWMKDAFGA